MSHTHGARYIDIKWLIIILNDFENSLEFFKSNLSFQMLNYLTLFGQSLSLFSKRNSSKELFLF